MNLPQTLGPYRLVELLGSGAFGSVYRAEVEGALGFVQDVAVKVLDSSRARKHPAMVASLADEAALLSGIQHPNIVQVRGLQEIQHPFLGRTYVMEMELVRGISLRALIDSAVSRGISLPAKACLLLAHEALEGLQAAHGMRDRDGQPLGLVHRDLKPDNLLVTRDGRLKILDFGIAWASRRRVDATETGTTKGTVAYMSPEQLRGAVPDASSDIYSLGVVLFELLTGEPYVYLPSELSSSVAATMRGVLDTEWERRAGLVKGALERPAPAGHGLEPAQVHAVEALVAAMLRKDPEERPTADALLADLDDLDSTWRFRRGREVLTELVGSEYTSFARIRAVTGGSPTARHPEASGPPAEIPVDERPTDPSMTAVSVPTPREETGTAETGPPPESVPELPVVEPGATRLVPSMPREEVPLPPPPEPPRSLRVPILLAGIALVVITGFGIASRRGRLEDERALARAVVTPPKKAPPPAAAPPEEPEVAELDEEVESGEVDADEDSSESATATPAPRPAPTPRPKSTSSPSKPSPAAEPAPVPVADRARTTLAHDPPGAYLPGDSITFVATTRTAGAGASCQPVVVLADSVEKLYRRHPMNPVGAVWSVNVPTEDADGSDPNLRYFLECCWGDDCSGPTWRSAGQPRVVRARRL